MGCHASRLLTALKPWATDMGKLESLADPEVKKLADNLIAAREQYELDTRQDLLRRIESLCVRWRHYSAGWDMDASRQEKDEGFERALDLLSDCHEELMD